MADRNPPLKGLLSSRPSKESHIHSMRSILHASKKPIRVSAFGFLCISQVDGTYEPFNRRLNPVRPYHPYVIEGVQDIMQPANQDCPQL